MPPPQHRYETAGLQIRLHHGIGQIQCDAGTAEHGLPAGQGISHVHSFEHQRRAFQSSFKVRRQASGRYCKQPPAFVPNAHPVPRSGIHGSDNDAVAFAFCSLVKLTS